MIQLLAVHIKEIRIAFMLWDPSHLIKITQSGFCNEGFLGGDECKLVEITAGDNLCVIVFFQDLGYEILEDSLVCGALQK